MVNRQSIATCKITASHDAGNRTKFWTAAVQMGCFVQAESSRLAKFIAIESYPYSNNRQNSNRQHM